jgi:subtilisin family serine protease
MNALDLVRLTQLMELSSGRPEIIIGLIDGPVALDHPNLTVENIRGIRSELSSMCTMTNSGACKHGTFVAGILSAKRGGDSPAICPNCTLLVRPIFTESISATGQMPSATAQELAEAIIDCVQAGTHILNLSAALTQSSAKGDSELEQALDYAALQGVITIAAAGNQGNVGSTVITRHSWVIPVVACDQRGYPLNYSNLGHSIGRQGLGAPGESIVSLGTNGNLQRLSGTSAAAPFVTGAAALLCSIFPTRTPAEVKSSLLRPNMIRRASVMPPLLDASTAYQNLAGLDSPRFRQATIPAY